jgi:DNA-directed RNA polymerase subunit F
MDFRFGKFVGVIAITLCASLALAQQGGGRGQGRGGFGQRGGGNNELTLLQRKDVQTDLGLTDDQVTKLADMAEKARAQRGQSGAAGGGQRQGGQGGQGGGQGGGQQMTEEERAKRAADAKARRDAQRKELVTIISEAQLKRVDQISLQIQGNNAILNPEMQGILKFSDDQAAKVKDLQAKQREAMTSLFEKMRNQEITREDMQASMQKNNDIMKAELGKIMTSVQAGILKEMGGKPFKADEE